MPTTEGLSLVLTFQTMPTRIYLFGLNGSSCSVSLLAECARLCMSLTVVMDHACSPVDDWRRCLLSVTSFVHQPSLWCLYNTHPTSNGLKYMLRNILNTQYEWSFLHLSPGWVITIYIINIHKHIYLLENLNSTQNCKWNFPKSSLKKMRLLCSPGEKKIFWKFYIYISLYILKYFVQKLQNEILFIAV